jgi:hypothetical protein
MNPGDLTTLANAKAWLGLSGVAIADISTANPAVVTLAYAPQTPLSSGLTVGISAVNGATWANGNEYVITMIDATHFSIPVDSTALAMYTDGGLAGLTDTLMQRLISAVSTYIQSALNRTIRNLPYVEFRSGQGGQTMLTLNFPITNVQGVAINGIQLPSRPPFAATSTTNFIGFGWQTSGPSGFVWDDLRVMVTGYTFERGFSNVQIDYAAGYLVTGEAQRVPAGAPFSLVTLAHWNAGDRGVTYADGSPLQATSYGSALTRGSYSVDPNGVYYFSSDDAAAAVLISYGYVPFDVEQAAVDMIGDWFRYRDRIGQTSMTIEAQSITFTNTAITARAQGIMNQYKRVAPVY